jgi:hypothetical protein
MAEGAIKDPSSQFLQVFSFAEELANCLVGTSVVELDQHCATPESLPIHLECTKATAQLPKVNRSPSLSPREHKAGLLPEAI